MGYLLLRNDRTWSVIRIKEGNRKPLSYKTLGENLHSRQQALELALKDTLEILVAFAQDDFNHTLEIIGKFDEGETQDPVCIES